ncbi:MAG: hypothetical protein GC168_09535 [Candidatus Hydrogenedens sp.]|nr:hypothetical protein [Candidatus Hydrogenedens sp.]
MPDSSLYLSAGARGMLLRALAVFFLVGAGAAHAGGAILLFDRTLPAAYTPPASINVTIDAEIIASGTIGSVGLEELIPPGWTYGGFVSGIQPIVAPDTGTNGNGGLLEFAWFPTPPATFSFTYRLNVPAGTVGTQEMTGRLLAQVDQQPEQSQDVLTRIIREGSGTRHSADTSDNFVISLSELLRVLQFYAIGGYSCSPNPQQSEDGFVAGDTGSLDCGFHDSDYEGEGDRVVSLVELLRLIQLYNARTYYECPGAPDSEDGFCPGPPVLD